MQRPTITLLFAAGFVAAACSKSVNALPDEASNTPTAPTIGATTTDGGTADAGVASNCADDTQDPYVLTDANVFYDFNPSTLDFTSKGILACLTNASPNSMAVDRQGFAWVRYDDGSVWKVDTKDLSCAATTFAQDETDHFYKFGMGFATTTAGSNDEVLFLSDSAGAGLGKLDLGTFKVTPIGPYTGTLAGSSAELTGTGDGKLYGFFTTAPAQIAEISQTTGAVISQQPLTGVSAGAAWAFSAYAGDFYIYTSVGNNSGLPRNGTGGGSDVTRYRPSDGSITVVKPKLGFTIVGAGVSTCAPTAESPK